MTQRRPEGPKNLLWAGIGLITFSAVTLPMVVSDPAATTRGIPLWIVLPVMFVAGVCLAVYGAVWLRRDRRPRD